jgi:3-keto-disaccharide hydrolase
MIMASGQVASNLSGAGAMKIQWLIGILTGILAVGTCRGAESEDSAGFRPLWNGQDLDGWYIFLQKSSKNADPEQVITIEDGAIHAYAKDRNGDEVVMGYIGTNQEYSNYHLRLQYKWGKKQFKPRYLYKPDAGIYFHHVTEDVVWPQAMQCQVELNGVGDLLTFGNIQLDTTIDPKSRSEDWQEFLPAAQGGEPYTTKGQGVTYTRKLDNFEQEGWNTVDVICHDDAAAVLVNGRLVNRCAKMRHRPSAESAEWKPLTSGRILLEFEATEMFYRNIELRPLAEGETLDQAIKAAAK